MEKHWPRANSTKPHENSQIKQHINRRLQRIILGLKAKPIVGSEGISGYETSQNVITSNHTAGSNDEEGQGDGEDEEALSVDEFLLFGPVEKLFGNPAYCGAVYDAEDDGIAPGFAKPKAHGFSSPSILTKTSVSGELDQV
jgi:hypothetical protein